MIRHTAQTPSGPAAANGVTSRTAAQSEEDAAPSTMSATPKPASVCDSDFTR